MLVTAQRVVSPAGIVGINTYLYRHPPGCSWNPEDLAALEEGAALERSEFEVTPGGNHVRSYLDLFAPEGTVAADLLPWFHRLRQVSKPTAFPVVLQQGSWVIHFNLDLGLVPVWRSELRDLLSDILMFLD